MSDLSDPGGAHTGNDDATGTDQQSRHYKHGDILGSCLENSTDEGDDGAQAKAPTTAPTICDGRNEKHADDTAERVSRVEDAEGRSGGCAEVVAPVCDRLETIHHGPVEAVALRLLSVQNTRAIEKKDK